MGAPMGVMVDSAPPRQRAATANKVPAKHVSGSSNRQRTDQVNVRFLPAERTELEQRAIDLGFTGPGKVQQYLRHLAGLPSLGAATG